MGIATFDIKYLEIECKIKEFHLQSFFGGPLCCTIYKRHYLQHRVVVGLVDVICEQRLCQIPLCVSQFMAILPSCQLICTDDQLICQA